MVLSFFQALYHALPMNYITAAKLQSKLDGEANLTTVRKLINKMTQDGFVEANSNRKLGTFSSNTSFVFMFGSSCIIYIFIFRLREASHTLRSDREKVVGSQESPGLGCHGDSRRFLHFHLEGLYNSARL